MKNEVISSPVNEIPTNLNLRGKHANKFKDHGIGKKGKATIHFTKSGHSTYANGKNTDHHIDLTIHKIDPMEDEDVEESKSQEKKEYKKGGKEYGKE